MLTWKRDAAIYEMLCTSELTYREIAARFGVSTDTVGRLAKKPAKHTVEEACRLEKEYAEHREKIAHGLQLVRQGHHPKDAAKAIGITVGNMYSKMRTAGVTFNRGQREMYIYGLRCPVSRQVYYVGSSVNPWGRYYTHVSRSHNKRLRQWVRALKKQGNRPELQILARVFTDRWLEIELEWIHKLAAEGHPLMNREAGWL